MAWIIQVSLYIYIRSIWPQRLVKHNQSSTWTRPLRELGDEPLGGRGGEAMELEGREPTINTTPHHSRHPNVIHETELCLLVERRNWVTRHDTTRCGESTLLRESAKSRTKQVTRKGGKDRVCVFIVWYDEMEMTWCLSTLGTAEYVRPITLYNSLTPVSAYTCRCSWKMYFEARMKGLWRCTWRLRSSELRDVLEAGIEWVWRYT